MREVCGRYAPSPTGPLHLGNLRTALVTWLQVRLQNGRLLLRMDDLDAPRNKPGSAQQILRDLDWLGIDYDGPVIYQSKRGALYQQAFDALNNSGHLFPCSCSRKDIQQALSAPDSQSPSSTYPGTCRPDVRPVDANQADALAWRFLVEDAQIIFCDQIYGPQQANLAQHPGDFVVKRKDGIFAYQLASVVDDGLLGVTDVVRGEDLLDSTPRQLALFEAMQYSPPRFWHVPLMRDEENEKLSKRDGADSLNVFKERGAEAETVIGMLGASLGLMPPGQQISCEELLQTLTLDGLRQALKTARA